MRTSALLSIALITAGISAAAVAQTNPFERFRRGQPAAKPMPQKPSNAGPIQDQGVHNAVHAAHQNQIVFTRIDTSVSGITEADIVTDFTLGQPMFFRVYTERSAVNAIAAANNLGAREVYADGVHYSARFTINGQVFDTVIFPWGNRRDHETWTTWRGQFVNPNKFVRVPGSDAFLEMLSRATGAGLLKPGKHTIKMELIAKTNTENSGPISAGTVATGSFNLTVPAGVFQASNAGVCGPVRGGVSPAIETRALSQAKQFWDKPDLTPVKAIAIGGEWTIEKNELTSIPIERWTYVSIVSRGPKYCTSQGHKFTEKYAGGGSYAAGGISVNYNPGYVPCACLN
jgi:hypothetical protein